MSHGGKKKHDIWASAACFQGGAPKRSKAFKINLTKKGVYMVGFISNLAPLLNDLLHTKSRPPDPARLPSGRGTGGYTALQPKA